LQAGDSPASFGDINAPTNKQFLELVSSNTQGPTTQINEAINGTTIFGTDLWPNGTSSNDTDPAAVYYNLWSNDTNLVCDALFNITRLAIQLNCATKFLLETLNVTKPNCSLALDQWSLPGFEDLDIFPTAIRTLDELPSQYRNISIQTFWGWWNLQELSTPGGISAAKHVCYQTVCAESFSDTGNLVVVGIGVSRPQVKCELPVSDC
jgi:hypothetical protein